MQRFRQTGDATHALYDRLVFSKVRSSFRPKPASDRLGELSADVSVLGVQVRDVMGGQLLYHTSGSAPIAKEVFETLKVTFGVDSIEVRPPRHVLCLPESR